MTDGTSRVRLVRLVATATLLVGTAGCSPRDDPASSSQPAILRVGFGLTTGANAQVGMYQAAMNIGLEGLIAYGANGRPQAWLAEDWSISPDGLNLRVRLRPGIVFHDGAPVTATTVTEVLGERLREYLGPAFESIKKVHAVSEYELEVLLKARSNFVLEGLDALVYRGTASSPLGTGAFRLVSATADQVEMAANEHYYGGRPFIDRILVTPYVSVRSAWAGLLRNELDMLYEVGVDAIDSLEPSQNTRIVTSLRRYASVVILNVNLPHLREPALRRALNAAVDRESLVRDALNGHGLPAQGPVWPYHWAYDRSLPKFTYEPRTIGDSVGLKISILYTEPSHERMALVLQRQLSAVGIRVSLEMAPLDRALARVQAGDFDAFLADVGYAPTLLRSSLFWQSRSPFNWGRYESPQTDAALDAIQRAPDDAAYKAGVAAFQKAIVDDPPAIFLVWGERARAVSTRFELPPVEPGVDILPTLRLWRPATDKKLVSPN